METVGGHHLTYCTNIHPSKGWVELSATLHKYLPELKKRLSPARRFGIGLCLSNLQATELLTNDTLQVFKSWLAEHNLYVFTINGFVYKEFHDQHIKDSIHQPDWQSSERVAFSKKLIAILSNLLPDDLNHGSISTQPLSYKYWPSSLGKDQLWQLVTQNLTEAVAYMIQIKNETGKCIHLDLEAEPDCLIENGAEMCQFYQDWLLVYGAQQLAKRMGCTIDEAKQHILDHVQVCYDTCHVGVAYESASDLFDQYESLGVQVGKIQVSSALTLDLGAPADRDRHARWLAQFAEDKFLHQVIQKNGDGSFRQFRDLPEALEEIQDPQATEWRIHYHVPIFVESYHDGTGTTQSAILEAVAEVNRRSIPQYFEVETYTWDVLPPHMRLDLVDSIERELRWLRTLLN